MNNLSGYKVVFIGAGNLATQLSLAFQQSGCSILQVYSKTEVSASALGKKLKVPYTTSLSDINLEADFYIISVKDYAIAECIRYLQHINGLLVHTAGSVPISVFSGFTSRAGVLYPLQTFSKNRMVCFQEIPFFIEAFEKEDEKKLCQLVSLVSGNINIMSSEKRKYLHLAAVFACNFTNHMYNLSSQILEEQGVIFDYLQPLIKETAAKVQEISPDNAQTGPAVRYDKSIIDKHLELLSDDKKEIYELISRSICKTANRSR